MPSRTARHDLTRRRKFPASVLSFRRCRDRKSDIAFFPDSILVANRTCRAVFPPADRNTPRPEHPESGFVDSEPPSVRMVANGNQPERVRRPLATALPTRSFHQHVRPAPFGLFIPWSLPSKTAMPVCLIALGSNCGDSRSLIESACRRIDGLPGTTILAQSSLYTTTPVGGPATRVFLNGCAELETRLSARELMQQLLDTEQLAGRQRATSRATIDRTLDLDLLLYGDEVLLEPGLNVPHPRMSFRRFVLEPAAEVAPHRSHPVWGSTLGELLAFINRPTQTIAVRWPGTATDRLVVPEADNERADSPATDWTIDRVGRNDRQPRTWIEKANLLIEWCRPSSARAELWAPEWTGPRWQIDPAENPFSVARNARAVETAMAAMQVFRPTDDR